MPESSEPIESVSSGEGWTLIALVPHDGKEPPPNVSDQLARAVWCAVSAPWHPSLLARAAGLPRIEPVESPSPPGPREVRIIAEGAADRLPSGYRTQAEDAGAALLDSGTDRAELIGRIQSRMGVVGAADIVETEPMAAASSRFPGARHGPMDASRPDRRDGAFRERRPREPLARADGRSPRLAAGRLSGGGESPPRRVRGA